MNHKGMPAELMNELFASMPLENAFGFLAKMPNGLLARNIQKMINGFKEALKNNKWNAADSGPELQISEYGLFAKNTTQNTSTSNVVRANLPIPSFNFIRIKIPKITFYFELQILKKPNRYSYINMGFCDQQFPLECKCLGLMNNSGIGIWSKDGIWIDGFLIELKNANGRFTEGDFVGLGIIHQPNSKMECFATLNGKLLGKIQLPAKFATIQLFPAIELYYYGDSVRVNFGKEEWQFKEFGSVF